MKFRGEGDKPNRGCLHTTRMQRQEHPAHNTVPQRSQRSGNNKSPMSAMNFPLQRKNDMFARVHGPNLDFVALIAGVSCENKSYHRYSLLCLRGYQDQYRSLKGYLHDGYFLNFVLDEE